MNKIWRFLSYVLVAALATFVTLLLCVGTDLIPAPAGKETYKLKELSDLIDSRFIAEHDYDEILFLYNCETFLSDKDLVKINMFN